MRKAELIGIMRREARDRGARAGDQLARKNQAGSRFYTTAGGNVLLMPISSPRQVSVKRNTRPQDTRSNYKMSLIDQLAATNKRMAEIEALLMKKGV